MNRLLRARTLLRRILAQGPHPGSRLKVLLKKEHLREFGEDFDEGQLGFAKFADFLESQADLLSVSRPEGPGDIHVSLTRSADSVGLATSAESANTPRLPRAIWQAFTNPDPNRRRFYDRHEGTIIHYQVDDGGTWDTKFRQMVDADSERFVEVPFVDADTQAGWMKEFVDTQVLPPGQMRVLSHLLEMPYSSSVNTAFVAALGPHAGAWKFHRSKKVVAAVRDWVDAEGLDIGVQWDPPSPESEVPGTTSLSGAEREVLHTLIDTLSDEDLDRILIPLGVLARRLSVGRPRD